MTWALICCQFGQQQAARQQEAVNRALKFREHAAAAVAKSTQVLAVIRRSFALIDDVTLSLLFTTLVRPHLEFGNLIWGPFNRADQRLVERVQRRATRMVESVRHKPYEDRLGLLQLPSLYYRRRRGDMVHTYQLFHGSVDASPSRFFTLADGPTRGHPLKIHKQASKLQACLWIAASCNEGKTLMLCCPDCERLEWSLSRRGMCSIADCLQGETGYPLGTPQVYST